MTDLWRAKTALYALLMSYFYHTRIPNTFFEQHQKHLGYAQVHVLLVIIRATYGWVDKRTGKQKQWAWLSQRFFVGKTNLSGKAVSTAIDSLVTMNLIQVKNQDGKVVHSKKARQYSKKLFYHYCVEFTLHEEDTGSLVK